MSQKLRVADRKPIQVKLEPGKHAWCACGHDSLSGFNPGDLTAWKPNIADLAGVRYAGVGRM